MAYARAVRIAALGLAMLLGLLPVAWSDPPAGIRTIDGSVHGPQGPLEGASVQVSFSESTADPPDVTSLDEGHTLATSVYTTDDRGRYKIQIPAELVGNPRLRIVISAAHPQYFERTVGPVPVADSAGRAIETGAPYWAHRQAAVTAIHQTRLRSAKTLSGRVLTAEGLPAAGAQVTMRSKADPYGWKFRSPDNYSCSDTAATDEQGRFTLRIDNPATLSVELPGQAPLVLDHLQTYPGIADPDPVFHMPPGFRPRGRVLAVDGQPIAGAIVVATRDARWDEFNMPLWYGTSAATDTFGRYELPPLPAGKYRFAVLGRVADLARIDEFNRASQSGGLASYWHQLGVPTTRLDDVVVPVVRDLGPQMPPLDLQAVETVTITARVEFPDGRPDDERKADLTVSGRMEGQPWSGNSVLADADGLARLIVPRGVQDVFVGTSLARLRKSADDPEEIGTAIQLGTLNEDLTGLSVVEPRLATLKVKLKFSPELAAELARPKSFLSIAAWHARQGHLGSNPQARRVMLVGSMQTNSDTYRGKALPNEELVLRVTKRIDGAEAVLHEERLTLQPGEERLREITVGQGSP